jgi:hypothetical protein
MHVLKENFWNSKWILVLSIVAPEICSNEENHKKMAQSGSVITAQYKKLP